MPPWLSFVRGAGAWSSAAPVLERAELSRSCKGKGKAFLGTCESATELVAKNNGGEAEQAPRCLPMVGIRARQRPERLEGEQENTPGDERGTGKLAQQQQRPPPKQMGMEKTARESRCLKGGGRKEVERKKNGAMASILLVPPLLVL